LITINGVDGFAQTILSSKVIPIDSSTKLKEAKSI
jgi:hypothetical protein